MYCGIPAVDYVDANVNTKKLFSKHYHSMKNQKDSDNFYTESQIYAVLKVSKKPIQKNICL